VIDVQKINTDFQLYLLIGISASVVLLSVAIWVLSFSAKKYGHVEDDIKQAN
jgi:hypothetical protein